MPWCRFLGGMLLFKSMSSGRPSPINDDPVDVCGGMLEVQAADDAANGCKVHARGVDVTGRGKADKGRGRGRDNGKKAGAESVPPPAK